MLKRFEEQWGKPSPALQSRPTLPKQSLIYYEAFSILSGSRQNTDHTINPITFSDVMAYCDCIGEFEAYERLRYWQMINTCDRSWIEAAMEYRKKPKQPEPVVKVA